MNLRLHMHMHIYMRTNEQIFEQIENQMNFHEMFEIDSRPFFHLIFVKTNRNACILNVVK